jgi:hypothetical protein
MQRSAVAPFVVPERGLFAVPKLNLGANPKKGPIGIVVGKLGARPRPRRVSPLKPKPAQPQSVARAVKIRNAEPTQIL